MSLSFAFESQDFCCAENLIFLAVTSAFRLDNLQHAIPSQEEEHAPRCSLHQYLKTH
jgi:hypothetical protein